MRFRNVKSQILLLPLFILALTTACKSWGKFWAVAVVPAVSFASGSNLRDGGELYSGVIIGQVPAGAASVEVAFDSGAYQSATVNASVWKVFIPVGSAASAGLKRWQIGSKHKISARAKDASGNTSTATTISFTRQLNKDANGDGYSDVVAGAYFNSGGGGVANKGAAYIFYGSASNSGSIGGVTKHPENASSYTCSGPPDCTVIENPDNLGSASGNFGWSVAYAGDVNGDGYADVIIAAFVNSGGGGVANKGAAYIFYGSSIGMTSHPENGTAYSCSGPPDCTVIENPDEIGAAAGSFGYSVSSAGDVNGDGYADVVAGGWRNSGGGGAGLKGAAYIFYGSPTGITTHVENNIPYTCSGPPDCTVIENPDDTGGNFGISVSLAGDVNGDGYGEIIVGSQNSGAGTVAGGQTAGAGSKGAAYIFYGSASGATNHSENAAPYFCSGPPDCTVIENPDNLATGRFNTVSYAGDTNGDGYADVIVGAWNNSGGGGAAGKGAAYLFYGSSAGITLHAENNASYSCSGPPDCTVIESPLDLANGFFGNTVSFAGDVNGDGYADIVIGTPNNFRGQAYIFYGSSLGITSHPENAIAYTCGGPPDCTVLQNPDNPVTANFGYAAFAGDVNGDGYADIIAGAYLNFSGGGPTGKGSAYIFYGASVGITGHPENGTPYSCSGPPDCTVVENPNNLANGNFGWSVN